MAYEISFYEYAPGDLRKRVMPLEDGMYVLYCTGGSGTNITYVAPYCSWHEGADELMGVYATLEEAEAAQDKFLEEF